MGNIWKVILGVAAMAVSLVIYPIILDGVAAITSNANIADYTGLSAFANVLPLLILVGMIFGGGLLTFQGARGMRSGSKSKSGKKYS
ncbi:hypothetical protein DA01_07720 [Dehalococcoides mccartyi]|uniref:Uncharacterized protein n=1 Tax=Dehalococcoides mccartyi TaxID=61435 RepID=A0A0V8M0K7_9CHLR|nr:hypothetical protein [Dehalococcoides mccartyi]AQU03298.1 hypothetical protein B1773_04455 [Dehalococcoides mccartyi]KSV17307.1 hypothetical protein DA01_07720 [Dehalococcoides mccartyi]